MVRKRKEYHKAVKNCRHNANKLKMNNTAKDNLPDKVDNCIGEDAIVNKFKKLNHYIYNINESEKNI